MNKKFIILADDNEMYINLYKVKLIEQGWEVESVNNGQEALEAIEKRKPDILLLDLDMPIKSGFDVLKEIHDKLGPDQVIAIVMTDSAKDSDVNKALVLGAKSYFVKSDVSAKEMIELIKKYLV